MSKRTGQKPASREKSLWGQSRVGKYSLEEIALEFLLWEDDISHSDRLRRDFIYEALQHNFGHDITDETVNAFLHTYERLYKKIYQHTRGPKVTDNLATPERVRRLLHLHIQQAA
jgi:hypothetical protein